MADIVTLAECPVGLCETRTGVLLMKTEYGSNDGSIDVYIVQTGERFWGPAPQTAASQRAFLVRPIDAEEIAALRARVAELEAALREAERKLDYADRESNPHDLADWARGALEDVRRALGDGHG